jgi:CRISPR/Cas system-associated exonuclease Cas4 (RecB family)
MTGEKMSFEDCIECSKHHSRCDLTPPMLRGMLADQPRSEGISVTTLSSCPRKAVLQTKEPYWTRPDEDWWAFRGRLAHLIVEAHHGDDAAVVEEEFSCKFRDITVVGHPDVIYPEQGLIVDYKSTAWVPKDGQVYGSHEEQLNCYRYLVMIGKRASTGQTLQCQIDRLVVAYFDMKRPRCVEIDVWPLERAENYIGERAERLSECFKYDSLPDVEVEKWECDYCRVAGQCKKYGSSLMMRVGRREG